MINDRKKKLLQAILMEFIANAEPVGSRTLTKRYDLGLSPATIRNEMSDLEEMGFLPVDGGSIGVFHQHAHLQRIQTSP